MKLNFFYRSFKGSFGDFLNYAKAHRILIQPEHRIEGIVYTLMGWGLIALSTTVFHHPTTQIPNRISLLLQFASAGIFLFLIGIFKGISFFKISETTSEVRRTRGDVPCLSAHERIALIITRSVIAIVGYMLYGFARQFSAAIDHSLIFGADALAYALLLFFLLKRRLAFVQWIGIAITSLGILSVYAMNASVIGPFSAIPGLVQGLGSSFALAAIILVNSVLIQHDPPLRVAFYQCLIGLFIFSISNFVFYSNSFLIISQMLSDPSLIKEFIDTIISGILYGISLLFFFRAFLFAEPIVIAALTHSLPIFIEIVNYITFQHTPTLEDFAIKLTVAIGCWILIQYEYYNDKRRAKVISHGAYYIPNLLEKMLTLKEMFNAKSIEWVEYMSKIHEFNKLLFGFSKRLQGTQINNIEINKQNISFSFDTPKIKIITDGACRSAPFEILNFGKYEAEEPIVYNLIEDGYCIFDIGAHIGWFALNFASRFPNSKIYAFEPIKETYEILEKNIKINSIKNIITNNYGFSNTSRDGDFYYFKGGSAVSSERNLLNHKKTEIKRVRLEVLDAKFASLGINKLDFLKCDVEGNELFVLEGARKTISKALPILYIELYDPWCQEFGYSANDVFTMLQGFGYKCFSIEDGKCSERMIIKKETETYNYFFLHREKHARKISLIENYPYFSL